MPARVYLPEQSNPHEQNRCLQEAPNEGHAQQDIDGIPAAVQNNAEVVSQATIHLIISQAAEPLQARSSGDHMSCNVSCICWYDASFNHTASLGAHQGPHQADRG